MSQLPEQKQKLMVVVTVGNCPPSIAAETGMAVFTRLYGKSETILQGRIPRKPIKTILLATDFSAGARKALRCAIALARRYDSRLVLTHVLPAESAMVGRSGPLMTDALLHDAEKRMAKLEETAELKSLPHEVVMQSGDSWDVISQAVADKQADLIVMGTHGRGGMKKLLLGSTAEKIIRHATYPVLTVGPRVVLGPQRRFNRILYASDFSSGSRKALAYAVSLSGEDRAHLRMLHLIKRDPVSHAQAREWKRRSREKLSRMVSSEPDLAYQPEIDVEFGVPELKIVGIARAMKANLVVMGAHTGGVVSRHLPWTTLHYVLQHAHCPVLTVRGE